MTGNYSGAGTKAQVFIVRVSPMLCVDLCSLRQRFSTARMEARAQTRLRIGPY